tara:strand:+ start:857 stop:2155 length:1299 start_codon:yes stop_codon:yes gene_type:complete
MLISGWGNYPKLDSNQQFVSTVKELSRILRNEDFNGIIRASARSYGDSSIAQNTINLSNMNKIISFNHKNGTLRCQSGTTINEIITHTIDYGWFFPVIPGTKFVSIGGAISSDVHGKNHHIHGCISNFVGSIKILLPSNEIIDCSKKENPELFYAICGGMGLIGIIIEVDIQLIKIPSSYIQEKSLFFDNLDELLINFEKYNDYLYSVAWLDFFSLKREKINNILYLGRYEEDQGFDKISRSKINIPSWNYVNFLNNLNIKLFNHLKVSLSKKSNTITKHIDKYFFPLDAINNWNNLYGRKGFIQYQFVIPIENGISGLKEIMKLIEFSTIKPYLSVLKLFGDKNKNLLSFPIKGWTLALDFKNDKSILDLIRSLDAVVKNYNGKIYLTKDSLMTEEMFKSTYENWEKFTNIRKEIGAEKVFNSVQSMRLGI